MEPGDILRIIYGTIAGRPMNVSFIDEYVCGSARPFHRKEIVWLKDAKNIEAILSLTESALRLNWIRNFDYKHVPIKNHVAPTISQLRESVDFILSQTQKKHKVLVHCAAGKGRTGTVLAAYMISRYHLSLEEAIKVVRFKRPGSIEKNHQEKALAEFSRTLTPDG